jgi:hypothetical protein
VKFQNEEAIAMLLSCGISEDRAHNPSALAQFLSLFSGVGGRVAMRCTRGPSGGAIGWHFDGGYASHTVQLALNDDSEYEGNIS